MGEGMKDLAEKERLEGRSVVHKFSFGKDSLSSLLALLDHGIVPEHVLYNDTGWEAREHYDYAEQVKLLLLKRYGVDIVTVSAHIDLPPDRLALAEEIEALGGMPGPSAMVRRILKYATFPRPTATKWCTDVLKVAPSKAWIDEMCDSDPVTTTGVRREESARRALYPAWEKYRQSGGLWDWRPIIDWTIEDVAEILTRHGMPRHPCYLKGSNRVGCWPCIRAGKLDLEIIGRDVARLAMIRRLEQVVADIRDEHETGFLQSNSKVGDIYPALPIDTAVAWSRTSHGGKALLMFPRKAEDPCERWGWCEV